MLDRERTLAKLDELVGYLKELQQVPLGGLDEHLQKVEKRRACERLLQIAIGSMIGICGLLVADLRLGLPAEENDSFEKLDRGGILSASFTGRLRQTPGIRDMLVHEYPRADGCIVFEATGAKLADFQEFGQAVREPLRKETG